MYFILAQVGKSIHQLTWKDNLDNLRYLENLEVEKKKVLLSGIVESVGVIFVGEKRYSIDTLVQAFEYFVLWQSTYNHLKTRLSAVQYFHYHEDDI